MGRTPSEWEHPATYIFLTFAFSFWPLYMPLAFYVVEQEPRRRRWMRPLLLLGAVAAVYSGRHIFTSGGEACIEQHHIDYWYRCGASSRPGSVSRCCGSWGRYSKSAQALR